jgi:ParB family chromosome partitioning protein
MLCGRSPGHAVDGRFVRDELGSQPVIRDGRWSCGACGGSLILERDQRGPGILPMGEVDEPPRVVRLSLSDLVELPGERSSRLRYDVRSLEELAISIREHGLLEPLLVRPVAAVRANGHPGRTMYEVIAGNRRLKAARRAGLEEVDCLIRITDAEGAFVLNVVENLQRRELSGRERVRAITMLAGMADDTGTPLGVRAISRRTGLSPATISLWLQIHRRPVLRAALEEERLDVGRTMKLVRAPDEKLPELIDRAQTMSQDEIVAAVSLVQRDNDVVASRRAAANARRALMALNALQRIDEVDTESVRGTLEQVHTRLEKLLRA